MTIHNFKYYIHDTSNDEEAAEHIFSQIQDVSPQEIVEHWMGPFYEVTFQMTYDDETHEFKVVSCDALK